jgi:hypothetical protein
MRKLRVALVILLFLAFITLSQTGSAISVVSPKGMGDGISMSKSKAELNQIQKKLMSGSSDIADQNQVLSNYAKYMAAKNMQNASNKTRTTVKPPAMSGFNVPMTGIGDAIKTLGSTEVSFSTPAAALKTMKMPKLAVMK